MHPRSDETGGARTKTSYEWGIRTDTETSVRPSIHPSIHPTAAGGRRDATHGSVGGMRGHALVTFGRGRGTGPRVAVRLDARQEHARAAAQARRRRDVAGQSGGQHRVVQHAAVVHQAAPDLQTTGRQKGSASSSSSQKFPRNAKHENAAKKNTIQLSIWRVHD